MEITKEWMENNKACQAGIDWVLNQKETDPIKLIKIAIKSNEEKILNYANWGICRVFNKIQKIKYAIYAARQVLHIFENEYPDDDRPRKAIKSAENYICDRNNSAAAHAYAADAAYDAAYDAAHSAADAAYAAADSAHAYAAHAYAADAAYDAAYDAAHSAADAAYAYAAHSAKMKIKIKILEYGMELSKGEN